MPLSRPRPPHPTACLPGDLLLQPPTGLGRGEDSFVVNRSRGCPRSCSLRGTARAGPARILQRSRRHGQQPRAVLGGVSRRHSECAGKEPPLQPATYKPGAPATPAGPLHLPWTWPHVFVGVLLQGACRRSRCPNPGAMHVLIRARACFQGLVLSAGRLALRCRAVSGRCSLGNAQQPSTREGVGACTYSRSSHQVVVNFAIDTPPGGVQGDHTTKIPAEHAAAALRRRRARAVGPGSSSSAEVLGITSYFLPERGRLE